MFYIPDRRTRFDLASVPSVYLERYQQKNDVHLETVQDNCKLQGMIVLACAILLGFVAYIAVKLACFEMNIDDTEAIIMAIICAVGVSVVTWFALSFLQPCKAQIEMDKFIYAYRKARNLIDGVWKFQNTCMSMGFSSPSEQDEYLPKFVAANLWHIMDEIRTYRRIRILKLPQSSDFEVLEIAASKKIGRVFNTLKPFALDSGLSTTDPDI